MTDSAVAFVPCAPLLIPAVAGGSADVDAELRAASVAAVQRLLENQPTDVVVVASTPTSDSWPADATWDFAGFGVPRMDLTAAKKLPWSLGIGAWLLDECGWTGARRYLGISTADCEPAVVVANAAMLVLGDGTACRSEKAPGHLDPRAAAFDAAIADCLKRGDVESLGAVDPGLAGDLLCAGAPVWRWLASQLRDRTVETACLDVAEAPYGVGYFVATWTLATDARSLPAS